MKSEINFYFDGNRMLWGQSELDLYIYKKMSVLDIIK